jgi:hypothetical protein
MGTPQRKGVLTMNMYYPNKEYYEVHYQLEECGDVEFVSEYRGKAMRKYSTAEKCMEQIKKKIPTAIFFEIALYDESGRID